MSTQMAAKTAYGTYTYTMAAGQRIRIQILAADGSEVSLLCDDAVPSGKSISLTASYSGNLENA